MDDTRLRSGLLFRRIVDEGLLLDLEEDVGYRLNEVGIRIVSLLSEGVAGEVLIERLCEEFEIDRESCAAEVDAFVAELRGRDLLRGD